LKGRSEPLTGRRAEISGAWNAGRPFRCTRRVQQIRLVRRRLLGGIASHGGERRQPAVPAWCSADRMRTCAPWSRLVAELPDYGDRLLSNSQLMANDQRPYGWRLWSLQRARPRAGCIAISRSLLLGWQRYRRPHPCRGANKFSAGNIALAAPVSAERQGGWTLWVGGVLRRLHLRGWQLRPLRQRHRARLRRNPMQPRLPTRPRQPGRPALRGNPVYPARSTCSSKSLNP